MVAFLDKMVTLGFEAYDNDIIYDYAISALYLRTDMIIVLSQSRSDRHFLTESYQIFL